MSDPRSASREEKLGNPFSAIMTAVRDIRDTTGLIEPPSPSLRLDGKTCLVTGANSGLGRAIATDLAQRGASVILAGRSGIPTVGEEIATQTGNKAISMRKVDLSDLRDVRAFCAQLAADKVRLDRLILNAGLMAPKAEKTPQGFEHMFAVHYLANQLIIEQLVATGVVPKKKGARIIAVSSESHRSSPPIDMSTFGDFQPHSVGGAMKQYGYSKLALNLMIQGMARRLTDARGAPEVGVFHMCPGPINSNIARKSPAMLRAVVKAAMGAFFPSPEKAAQPVIHLTVSPELDGKTGEYMHLMRFKPPSDASLDKTMADAVLAYGTSVFETLPQETS